MIPDAVRDSAPSFSRDIFQKRVNIKPYEYPELLKYVDGIQHSYWLKSEFNYDADVQDVKVRMLPHEVTSVKRAMMAISQIESAVKTFWSKVYDHLPKPEVAKVGAVFAESEVRHEEAYSELLERLGLNHEFENLKYVPAMKDRIEYINKINFRAKAAIDPKQYFESIIFFSVFIENISLFSQFYIIMAFNKFDNKLKGMSNAVEATSKEEELHANFGFDIINIIKEENPGWFDESVQARVYDMARKAYAAEEKALAWIYEQGDVAAAPKEVVLEFIKDRLNTSLETIGLNRIFPIHLATLEKSRWFTEEISITKNNDFFQKRSTNYTSRAKAITEEDLF